jgi:hypothetical protein
VKKVGCSLCRIEKKLELPELCKGCSVVSTLRAQLAAARAKAVELAAAVELAGEVDETILRCENCEHEYVSGCSEPCISCIAGGEITRKHHSKYAAVKTAADVLKEWG